jgi:hypothetical protein
MGHRLSLPFVAAHRCPASAYPVLPTSFVKKTGWFCLTPCVCGDESITLGGLPIAPLVEVVWLLPVASEVPMYVNTVKRTCNAEWRFRGDKLTEGQTVLRTGPTQGSPLLLHPMMRSGVKCI